MTLWIEWFRCIHLLRNACARRATFMWMALILTAMATRTDLLGVTSFVRAAFLEPCCYPLLLNFFHSHSLVLSSLVTLWTKLAMTLFRPVTVGGYVVFAADGLKVSKEGRKMPAVKSLHQESANNSKAEYIMGHSFQAIALLVHSPLGHVFAVPLISRICEGLIWNRSQKRRSLLDKLVELFQEVIQAAQVPALLVADAYYASHKVINPLLVGGHHLVTRVKITSVAFLPAPPKVKKTRGRPRKYGPKVRLRNLFKGWQSFSEAKSPVYGEHDVTIQYSSVDLLWRPVGRTVRFVLVKHPTRGKIILLCTNLNIDPLAVIKIYGLRFKIEVSFKQAIHTIGAYAYHFWMKPMQPIKRTSGNQNISRQSDAYKRAITRKIAAYHRYVQLACITQGLLQHLAINFRGTVWRTFRSWLRTMKTDMVPSEMVVAYALRSSFPEFLLDRHIEPELKKFILDRATYDRIPGFNMVA
jgi:hypothetical protein